MLEQAKCYKSGSDLRDKVTRVIIVLFVGGQVKKQAAHHRFSSSQEWRFLVVSAASLGICLFVPL